MIAWHFDALKDGSGRRCGVEGGNKAGVLRSRM